MSQNFKINDIISYKNYKMLLCPIVIDLFLGKILSSRVNAHQLRLAVEAIFQPKLQFNIIEM